MRRVISWLLNLTGWTLDGRELAKIAGGSVLGSGVMSAVPEFIRSLPLPILISIIIGVAILLFVGFSYLWDAMKKRRVKKPISKDETETGNSKAGKKPRIFKSMLMISDEYTHKCSQCGFGVVVNKYDTGVVCPECGNADDIIPKL